MDFGIAPGELRGLASGRRVGVLTSGGDAPGMNAALRAVVRTARFAGAEAYAIAEGFQGLIEDSITPFSWHAASGILGRGGTAIGTVRSAEFMTRAGMLTAAEHLVNRGIDRLVVIGGDGSLSGLAAFSDAWVSLLDDLVAQGRLSTAQRAAHPRLISAGIAGSIDNDLVGTDMTVGTDSALHRIQDAIDAITSTAASHQRCFVVEVMGRRCGYLAVAAAISGGCDYVLLPEYPPADGWEQAMCEQLRGARAAGRKESVVILAEGAVTRDGTPISAESLRRVIETSLGEEARVTILGHVQRGGTPSAYDRWAPTWLGYAATAYVLTSEDGGRPVFGFRGEAITAFDLGEAVAATRAVPELVAAGRYDEVAAARGPEFADLIRVFKEMSAPARTRAGAGADRIAVLHAGALAPGMNIAAKMAVRLGISRGLDVMGVHEGFTGLANGEISRLTWKDVDGWNQAGGAQLGTRRYVPPVEELYDISRHLEAERIRGLVIIGGWSAYDGAGLINQEASRYPGLRIPVVCVPASIDNNLPGTAMSIGADTALGVVVDAIDRVKMSASASRRCFVIETMGRDCGYLALMGGFAGGAEQAYLPETGITLDGLRSDIEWLLRSFDTRDRTLFLGVRGENASPNYTTAVIANLFDAEGAGRYDTRTLTIGHVQQGATPTPADRLLATRLADAAVSDLVGRIGTGDQAAVCVGLRGGAVERTEIGEAWKAMEPSAHRPREQWWMTLKPIFDCVNREVLA